MQPWLTSVTTGKTSKMANTELDWTNYVRVEGHVINIRSSFRDDWDSACYFALDEAEDMANHVLAEVAKARRDDPEIKELASCLRESNMEASFEDAALYLHRKGYRKDENRRT